MLLHFFRTANCLNEFFVFASPIGFLFDFRLFFKRTSPNGFSNIHFGFSSLRWQKTKKKNEFFNFVKKTRFLLDRQTDTYFDSMFGCIENFTFFCCRFFAYNFMLLKAIIVEKAITNATGCTIFGWCGRFFSWLFREENDNEKSGKFIAKKKKKKLATSWQCLTLSFVGFVSTIELALLRDDVEFKLIDCIFFVGAAVAEWLIFESNVTFSGVNGVDRTFDGGCVGNLRRLFNEFALPSSAIDFFIITGLNVMLFALLLLLFIKFAKWLWLALFEPCLPLFSDRSSSSSCDK